MLLNYHDSRDEDQVLLINYITDLKDRDKELKNMIASFLLKTGNCSPEQQQKLRQYQLK
jgi:hypothetical protein